GSRGSFSGQSLARMQGNHLDLRKMPQARERVMKNTRGHIRHLFGLALALTGFFVWLAWPNHLILLPDHLWPATGSGDPDAREMLPAQAEQDPRRFDQPDEALAFYRLKRLPVGGTDLPVERYLAAREKMRAMPLHATSEQTSLSAPSAL